MIKELFSDKTPDEKFELLEASADKKVFFNYEKQFSNQEIDLFREQLGDVLIEIDKIEVDKAKITKEYNDQLKPLKKQLKEIVDNVRFRGHMVEELVYVFIDHDNNTVDYYTKIGVCVNTRPLKFDEQQRSIMGEIRDNEDEQEVADQTAAADYVEVEEEKEDWEKLEDK